MADMLNTCEYLQLVSVQWAELGRLKNAGVENASRAKMQGWKIQE